MYRDKRSVILYLLPAVLIVTLFVYVTIAMNFYNSLFRWSSYSPDRIWVAAGNYLEIFHDGNFWNALKNNCLYAVFSLIFQIGVSLILAAVLEQKWLRRFGAVCRTIYFIPSIISLAVVGLLFQTLLSPTMGVVNPLLEMIGLGGLTRDWLGNASTAIYAIIAVEQWQYIGYTLMLFIIAIQKIPADYYEAAAIDGADSVQSFFYVTVPNVREMLLLNMTTTLIGAFKIFDAVYTMTYGGPGRSSEVLGIYLYRSAFRNDRLGYASAIAALIFLITFVLSVIQIRMYNVGESFGKKKKGGVPA